MIVEKISEIFFHRGLLLAIRIHIPQEKRSSIMANEFIL